MIIVIVGPTGVGKTKLSLALAKKYQAIIVNGDAMQVYQGLDIGTAKVTKAEKGSIKHYLFDICTVYDDYNVAEYQKDCRKILDQQQDKNIIIVGGTGLYIKAALYDYHFLPEEEDASLINYDNETLYQMALKKDPAMIIHPNNRQRLLRFLSKKAVAKTMPLPLYDFKMIGLTTKRDQLYNIIDQRVEQMINSGLKAEVEFFYRQEINTRPLNSGIGYKEIYQYFNKELSWAETVELIKKNSRKYAKRQYTWFNNQFTVKWFEVNFEDFEKTIIEVNEYIEKGA